MASQAYFNDVQFLVIGGLLIAIAVETWNVHERIALSVLQLVGAKIRPVDADRPILVRRNGGTRRNEGQGGTTDGQSFQDSLDAYGRIKNPGYQGSFIAPGLLGLNCL